MKLTLDTNCLIDVHKKDEDTQKNTYSYKDVLVIAAMHNHDHDIATVAGSASEIQIDGARVENISNYFLWLKALNLSDLETLKPMLHWGMGFWGWAVYTDDTGKARADALHGLLFPNVPLENPTQPVDKKWRNARHDVLILEAHIRYGRDIFITRDKNFLKKATQLQALGAGQVMHPREFLEAH